MQIPLDKLYFFYECNNGICSCKRAASVSTGRETEDGNKPKDPEVDDNKGNEDGSTRKKRQTSDSEKDEATEGKHEGGSGKEHMGVKGKGCGKGKGRGKGRGGNKGQYGVADEATEKDPMPQLKEGNEVTRKKRQAPAEEGEKYEEPVDKESGKGKGGGKGKKYKEKGGKGKGKGKGGEKGKGKEKGDGKGKGKEKSKEKKGGKNKE
ncbi:uncharacterized protein LOC144769761 [Lissotriton helveticus]